MTTDTAPLADPTDEQLRDLLTDGALTIASAVEFTGICRTFLYQHAAGEREPRVFTMKNGTKLLFPKRALVGLLVEYAKAGLAKNEKA